MLDLFISQHSVVSARSFFPLIRKNTFIYRGLCKYNFDVKTVKKLRGISAKQNI